MFIDDEGVMDFSEHRIEVTGLLDPSHGDLECGLRCEGTEGLAACEVPLEILKVPGRHANRMLIDDYAYWFENWPADSDELDEEVPPCLRTMMQSSLGMRSLMVAVVACALGGASTARSWGRRSGGGTARCRCSGRRRTSGRDPCSWEAQKAMCLT